MKRDRFIKFRMNAEEEHEINKRANSAGMSLSEYVRKSAVLNNFTVFDTGELYQLNSALRRIGVNINQIAAVANSTNNIYADDVSCLTRQMQEISDLVHDTLGRAVY